MGQEMRVLIVIVALVFVGLIVVTFYQPMNSLIFGEDAKAGAGAISAIVRAEEKITRMEIAQKRAEREAASEQAVIEAEQQADIWNSIRIHSEWLKRLDDYQKQFGKTFVMYLDPNDKSDAVFNLPSGTESVTVRELLDYGKEIANRAVWGKGDPPANWQKYFGNDNMARLNYIQTQTANKQGQTIAELVERVRKLEEPIDFNDISLY